MEKFSFEERNIYVFFLRKISRRIVKISIFQKILSYRFEKFFEKLKNNVTSIRLTILRRIYRKIVHGSKDLGQREREISRKFSIKKGIQNDCDLRNRRKIVTLRRILEMIRRKKVMHSHGKRREIRGISRDEKG